MTKVEERFPGKYSVSELELYLIEMKKKINRKIKKEKVENVPKAEAFVRLVDDVLKLSYFKMNIDVFTLMNYLKEDSRRLDKEISMYQLELEEAKKTCEAIAKEPEVSEKYAIPDEWRQMREAEMQKRNDARQELYALTTVINELKREKQLLNRLKGMICRPKGFFAKL